MAQKKQHTKEKEKIKLEDTKKQIQIITLREK